MAVQPPQRFELDDLAHVEREARTIYAPGATPGDVLVVQSDHSLVAAPGGGSQTLAQVLTAGNDGGGLQAKNLAVGTDPDDAVTVSQLAPFTPTQISGLLLWIDAAQAAFAGGAPVASWADLSGNGNDLTQSDSGKRPLGFGVADGDLPMVVFDGVDDVLTSAGPVIAAPPVTLAVAARIVSDPGVPGHLYSVACNADPAVGGSIGPYIAVQDSVSPPFFWTASGGDAVPFPAPHMDNNGPADVVIVAQESSGYSTDTVNRVARGQEIDSPWQLAGLALGDDPSGAGQPVNVGVCEVLVYAAAITAAEREQLATYLLAKWGIL